jgi:hypothetical protein
VTGCPCCELAVLLELAREEERRHALRKLVWTMLARQRLATLLESVDGPAA